MVCLQLSIHTKTTPVLHSLYSNYKFSILWTDDDDKILIPGLDFDSNPMDLDKSVPKKKVTYNFSVINTSCIPAGNIYFLTFICQVPYAKPIPKSFEQAWETGVQPPAVSGGPEPNGMADQGGPMGHMGMRPPRGRGMGMRGPPRGQ